MASNNTDNKVYCTGNKKINKTIKISLKIHHVEKQLFKNPDFKKYKALSLFVHPCYMEQLLNRKKRSCPLPVMQLITVASVTITDDKAQDSIQQGYAKT